MKNYFATAFLLCVLFLMNGCGKRSISDNGPEQIKVTTDKVVIKANVACNSPAPQQSLQWLNNIIRKAEEDRLTKKHMGNYLGKIFLTSYKSQPIFYITMMMGSGGLAAYIYDCSGKSVTVSEGDVNGFHDKAQQGTLIYSSMP